MRDIKFKAKRKDNNEWVEGYYQRVKHFLGIKCIYYIVDEEQNYYEVISETVCQYTGLKDINGVEIYENDIVEEGCNGFVSSVIWDNEVGTYKLKDLGDYYIKDATIEWEVIGNIYDKEVK